MEANKTFSFKHIKVDNLSTSISTVPTTAIELLESNTYLNRYVILANKEILDCANTDEDIASFTNRFKEIITTSPLQISTFKCLISILTGILKSDDFINHNFTYYGVSQYFECVTHGTDVEVNKYDINIVLRACIEIEKKSYIDYIDVAKYVFNQFGIDENVLYTLKEIKQQYGLIYDNLESLLQMKYYKKADLFHNYGMSLQNQDKTSLLSSFRSRRESLRTKVLETIPEEELQDIPVFNEDGAL
ncbi:MAG: hypothetical protein ACK5Z5_05975 [Neisseriaceae bacterium]